jgi:Ca2+-binding EF-hand superfamily protein
MTFRRLSAFATLPMVVAGIALGAYAQGQPAPTIEQPVAARDKALVESAFTKVDANSDGKLTRSEAARLPTIAAKFDALDKDKDGMLSLEEFATGFIAPD